MKPSQLKNNTWFIEIESEKVETTINICVSLIKQHWKKVAEIPKICDDFLTWNIQKFH